MEGRSSGEAAPDEAVGGADARRVAQEQAGVAQLTEVQKGDRELREELQRAKDDYKVATGTWGRRPADTLLFIPATAFLFLRFCSFYLEKVPG